MRLGANNVARHWLGSIELEILASVLSFAALVGAWLYAVKQLPTVHVALRHALGAMVGLVAMFIVVLSFVFIGVFAPQGQNTAASGNAVSPSVALLESLQAPVKAQATAKS